MCGGTAALTPVQQCGPERVPDPAEHHGHLKAFKCLLFRSYPRPVLPDLRDLNAEQWSITQAERS
jgi:hypothetical protein